MAPLVMLAGAAGMACDGTASEQKPRPASNAVATIVRFIKASPVFGMSQLFFFEHSNFGAFLSVSLSVSA
ncbi:hypothetical protein VQ02_24765 [Methylobacterium variabile]|uniref:Uncharacterized protein n=1 Tax=Methylobacterium variabile TaxID=298794 RepID=A0A0J6UZM1_9HYPH|nr:hypothetical protein VQ02_24765 [Methylobacterium variabile]